MAMPRSENCHVSLENIDDLIPPVDVIDARASLSDRRLNSPRSLEACYRSGVDPLVDLRRFNLKYFLLLRDRGAVALAQRRFERHRAKRHAMLQHLRALRDRIVAEQLVAEPPQSVDRQTPHEKPRVTISSQFDGRDAHDTKHESLDDRHRAVKQRKAAIDALVQQQAIARVNRNIIEQPHRPITPRVASEIETANVAAARRREAIAAFEMQRRNEMLKKSDHRTDPNAALMKAEEKREMEEDRREAVLRRKRAIDYHMQQQQIQRQ